MAKPDYKKLYQKAAERLKELRDADELVADLRANVEAAEVKTRHYANSVVEAEAKYVEATQLLDKTRESHEVRAEKLGKRVAYLAEVVESQSGMIDDFYEKNKGLEDEIDALKQEKAGLVQRVDMGAEVVEAARKKSARFDKIVSWEPFLAELHTFSRRAQRAQTEAHKAFEHMQEIAKEVQMLQQSGVTAGAMEQAHGKLSRARKKFDDLHGKAFRALTAMNAVVTKALRMAHKNGGVLPPPVEIEQIEGIERADVLDAFYAKGIEPPSDTLVTVEMIGDAVSIGWPGATWEKEEQQ